MPERLDLRYANLAAAVADKPGGDRLDDLGVGQSVDDGDHRAEVDDARGVRSGWHRRAQSGALVAELAQFKLQVNYVDAVMRQLERKNTTRMWHTERIPSSPHTTEKISMAPAPRPTHSTRSAWRWLGQPVSQCRRALGRAGNASASCTGASLPGLPSRTISVHDGSAPPRRAEASAATPASEIWFVRYQH